MGFYPGSPGLGFGGLGELWPPAWGRRGLNGECKPGSIPGPRTGARMACACPITDQLRKRQGNDVHE